MNVLKTLPSLGLLHVSKCRRGPCRARRPGERLAVRRAALAGAAVLAATIAPTGVLRSAAAHDPTALEPLELRRSAIVRAVERAAPAVVNISTEKLVRNPYYGGGSLFDMLFGRGRQAPQQYVQNSLGSGVLVSPEGHVVTNEHVVAAASRITVTLVDGRQVEADVVGTAPEHDLAVLELQGEDGATWPHVPVDFTGELFPGETVIAIGNPFGLESTVTTGVLSGTHRRMRSGGQSYTDFLQTDAAINPGNSGGALLTVSGELIGINTQIDARGQNLGFAIPVGRVRKAFHELVRFGEVLPVWSGLAAESLDLLERDVRRRLGVDGQGGLLVRRVLAGSPADRCGLRPGDVLTSVGGRAVRDYPELHTALSRVGVGQSVPMDIVRAGEPRRLQMAAEPFPMDRADELAWTHLGLRVADVPTSRRGGYVAIESVREGSDADRIGLHRGLVVVAIDGERVRQSVDFHRALARGLCRSSVLLHVSDGRATFRVPLPVR